MKESKTPQIALIGCGRWGRNLARNLHAVGALVAVSDNNAEHATNFAAEFKTSAHSWQEILADKNIDGAMLATPISQHALQAIQILQAGKHVFVEKPLATNLTELQAIADAADHGDLVVMAGHLLRYHPAFIKLQELIAAGIIGDIRHIVSERSHYSPGKAEEDVLWDFGPHDAAMVLALTNATPTHLFAYGQTLQPNRSTHDIFKLNLRFPKDIHAEIRLNRLAPKKTHCLTVWGTKGALVFDDTQPWESKLAHYIDGQLTAPYPLPMAEPLRLEVEHFLNCIRTHEEPRTDLIESQKIIALLEAAMEQTNPILEMESAA